MFKPFMPESLFDITEPGTLEATKIQPVLVRVFLDIPETGTNLMFDFIFKSILETVYCHVCPKMLNFLASTR